MSQLNPSAVNLWIFCTALGYVFGGGHGAALALAASSGVSFVLSLFIK
jgi:hypothetical protein